jgi:hypothetical protein
MKKLIVYLIFAVLLSGNVLAQNFNSFGKGFIGLNI